MKTTLLGTLGVLLAVAPAWGQGTINFSTKITGQVDAKVSVAVAGGAMEPADSNFLGQLFAGPVGGTLSAIGVPVPFRSDVGAGYITAGGIVNVPGIPSGSPASVQLRAWHVQQGSTYGEVPLGPCGFRGASAPIVITLGGGGTPPAPAANLVGLQGFVWWCPEPSPVTLGLAGALTLALLGPRRRDPRRGRFETSV